MKYPTRVMVAQYGTIAAGVLAGWSYAIVRFELVRTRVAVIVNATPPHWPFPTEVRLHPFRPKQLLPAAGVKRQNAGPHLAELLRSSP